MIVDVSSFNFGLCCEKLEYYEKALLLYKNCRELKPDFPDIEKKINRTFNKINQGD
jgi:hypothetical protein